MISLHTILVGMHLFGIAVGFGLAILIDTYMLYMLLKRKTISQALYDNLHFAGYIVVAGLALLWLSGLGFVAEMYFFNPEGLGNQKIYAKMTVVAILSINGYLIHSYALGKLKQHINKPMFADATAKQAGILAASGAVSGISWVSAFTIGFVKELNFAAAALDILAVYGVISLIVASASYLMINSLQHVYLTTGETNMLTLAKTSLQRLKPRGLLPATA